MVTKAGSAFGDARDFYKQTARGTKAEVDRANAAISGPPMLEDRPVETTATPAVGQGIDQPLGQCGPGERWDAEQGKCVPMTEAEKCDGHVRAIEHWVKNSDIFTSDKSKMVEALQTIMKLRKLINS